MVTVMFTALASSHVHARTGTGDPVEIFREHHPDEIVALHGQLRLRSAAYLNLDLDRGASPTSGDPLFAEDLAFGHDARFRFSPSVFLDLDPAGEVRVFLDADLVDASLGPIPSSPQPGDGASLADLRALGVDWMLPFGTLSIGRMPAHFGLGIAANDGADLDDDGGDRADRVALVMPLFGWLVAAAVDAMPQDSLLGEQAVTLGLMKWRAPWEVEMQRAAGRTVFDVGGAVSLGGSFADAPGFHAQLAASLDPASQALVVRRNTRFVLADVWARLVVDRFRVEAEAWAGDLVIDNPSPFPGVTVRTPIVGNPGAFAVVTEARLLEPTSDALFAQFEVGAASADPAAGFPVQLASPATPAYSTRASQQRRSTPDGFTGAGPGDVFGPQIALKSDMRFDAARIHPLHRIDLILWRTLLGGVSEAAYARAKLDGAIFEDDVGNTVRLDGNLVYSHALSPDGAPGGVAPLGVELDVGVEATLRALPFADDFGALSLRVDAGSLYPLGGLGARGGGPPSMAHMALVRLGYAL